MLLVQILDPDARLPERKTPEAAGVDIYAKSDFKVVKGRVLKYATGIAVKIPTGHVGRIHGRSSLEVQGLHTLAGVIDSDYKNEISIVFKNLGAADFNINKYDRIAQLIIYPIILPRIEVVGELPETERTGGFGSTGK